MKLLLLGGTQFLGRHVVDAALARGHVVTAFTRGKKPAPAGVRALIGERDPRVAPGLTAIERGGWDAVIDTSGYVPRIVQASVSLLANRIDRYLFVSSLSVIAKADKAGLDESAAVATLDDPASEDVSKHYGALKAACESVLIRMLQDRSTIVRPGLIVGPLDPTDRFGYWPARFVHPHLLGDRADHAVVPAPRERPLQFIDARDLAAWMLDLVERNIGGTFNACSASNQWTFGDLIDACVAASAAPPKPAWIADDVLEQYHVSPWTGLPLWIPASEADSAGFMQIDCSLARQHGLKTRSLADTIGDTAAWLASRDNTSAWKNVMTDARERQILSSCPYSCREP
ncbi:MAG TPA: NAD-dependent epimerase/dehydratase family protein [Casimicrobiaceae bacterium]|nr:NAD-dependent epimerase/dehydratase family protein [Casimicrobiaceae bacterium]